MEPKVDICFQAIGQSLPVDHGYALYSAISNIVPCFHAAEDVGLRLIRGRYIGQGLLDISPRAELVLRLPVARVADYLALAGKTLLVDNHAVSIGIPRTRSLVPAATLYAHLVTTRNGHDEERFRTEIARQTATVGVHAEFTLDTRRTFSIHGRQVVGYSLLASGLMADESIRLQELGLGGRRKMGCGFFEPRDHSEV
ncbi:type I-MYXAN CRISPR-associated protein Cas6/Cmx6 [Desulfocurvibacter africanus]|uniref:type I-MYXAN CRISPR-associated protein Cas6/Cmx6 n=1 Tax=Desulfocurvibacter africanus TaxID=873 RepID=UPI002FDB069A